MKRTCRIAPSHIAPVVPAPLSVVLMLNIQVNRTGCEPIVSNYAIVILSGFGGWVMKTRISIAEGDSFFSYVIFSKDGPNESCKLSCYRHSCFAWHFAFINESPVTSSQTSSGVVGDV